MLIWLWFVLLCWRSSVMLISTFIIRFLMVASLSTSLRLVIKRYWPVTATILTFAIEQVLVVVRVVTVGVVVSTVTLAAHLPLRHILI